MVGYMSDRSSVVVTTTKTTKYGPLSWLRGLADKAQTDDTVQGFTYLGDADDDDDDDDD